MRLIDADALIEEIRNNDKVASFNYFIAMVQTQPTAYDVEAVVAELVELRKQGYCQRVDMERCSESKSCIKCYEETLREIVRGKE